MKQPIYFFLFLALAIMLGVVVLKPRFLIKSVLGESVRTLEEFAEDEDQRSFEALLSHRDWRQLENEDHLALRPEYRITVWGSTGSGGERLRAITKEDEGWVLEGPKDLRDYVRPVTSAGGARALSELVRRVIPATTGPMNAVVGTILKPSADPSSHLLREGRYRPEDAEKWGIEFGVRVLDNVGSWTIEW